MLKNNAVSAYKLEEVIRQQKKNMPWSIRIALKNFLNCRVDNFLIQRNALMALSENPRFIIHLQNNSVTSLIFSRVAEFRGEKKPSEYPSKVKGP